jgi:hypothetical protein
MVYPKGMTYTMNPPVTTTVYPVYAWDEAYPTAVDVLGRYETFPEACRARDAFEARFTYDRIIVGEPFTVSHDRNVNPQLGGLV